MERAYNARKMNPIADVICRLEDDVDIAAAAIDRGKQRIELLLRIFFEIPLHEWSDAQSRGPHAVHLLIEAYTPGNALMMVQQGLVPRCPPWATRKYREASNRCIAK